jgi:hypothetical protein
VAARSSPITWTDLDQSFQDIGDELRNQYSIAYIPTNSDLDGRYHRIKMKSPTTRATRSALAAATTPARIAHLTGRRLPPLVHRRLVQSSKL